MLEVGNGGMTFDEYYAHFSLWCILKAPLLIGCSLENISQQTLTILGNEELIAINQDSLGKQGYRIKRQNTTHGIHEVWGGDLANNRFVVALFNRGDADAEILVSITNDIKKTLSSYEVRDVIEHTNMGIMKDDIFKATVKKHAIKVFVLKFLAEDVNLLREE